MILLTLILKTNICSRIILSIYCMMCVCECDDDDDDIDDEFICSISSSRSILNIKMFDSNINMSILSLIFISFFFIFFLLSKQKNIYKRVQ